MQTAKTANSNSEVCYNHHYQRKKWTAKTKSIGWTPRKSTSILLVCVFLRVGYWKVDGRQFLLRFWWKPMIIITTIIMIIIIVCIGWIRVKPKQKTTKNIVKKVCCINFKKSQKIALQPTMTTNDILLDLKKLV